MIIALFSNLFKSCTNGKTDGFHPCRTVYLTSTPQYNFSRAVQDEVLLLPTLPSTCMLEDEMRKFIDLQLRKNRVQGSLDSSLLPLMGI